jgi:putative heme transporter
MRDEHPDAGPATGDGEAGSAPAERRAGQVTPAPGPSAPAQPNSAQPAPAQPGSAQPGSAQPAPAQPAPAQPDSAQPAPAQPDSAQPERRRRWLRVAVAIVAVGAMAWLVVANRHTLAESLSSLGQLDFRWFALAVLCEGVSLTAFGLSRRRLLRADGHQAGFASVMAITYAGNALSMSVPFAGAQLAAVFSYQQFRRRGLDPALTGWALGISAIASSSALAIILVAGALTGGAPLVTAAGFAAAAVFALPALTVLLALRYPRAREVANKALASLIPFARRVLRKPGLDPAALDEFLTRLASIRLRWPQYVEVFGLATVNWLADCACLACAIHATGEPIPWRGLVLAYGAGAAVGSTGVTPGGFGLVEVTLTAALVAVGLATGRALTAVLAYRLINFWLILLAGGIAMIFLSRARENQIRRYTRPEQDPGASDGAVRGRAARSSGTPAGPG